MVWRVYGMAGVWYGGCMIWRVYGMAGVCYGGCMVWRVYGMAGVWYGGCSHMTSSAVNTRWWLKSWSGHGLTNRTGSTGPARGEGKRNEEEHELRITETKNAESYWLLVHHT